MLSLGEIVKVPVTLSLLVVLLATSSEQGRPAPLPASKFELYETAVDAVCSKAQEYYDLDEDADLQVKGVLQSIAVANMLAERRVFTGHDVLAALDSEGEVELLRMMAEDDTQGVPLVKILTVPFDHHELGGYEFQFKVKFSKFQRNLGKIPPIDQSIT